MNTSPSNSRDSRYSPSEGADQLSNTAQRERAFKIMYREAKDFLDREVTAMQKAEAVKNRKMLGGYLRSPERVFDARTTAEKKEYTDTRRGLNNLQLEHDALAALILDPEADIKEIVEQAASEMEVDWDQSERQRAIDLITNRLKDSLEFYAEPGALDDAESMSAENHSSAFLH